MYFNKVISESNSYVKQFGKLSSYGIFYWNK